MYKKRNIIHARFKRHVMNRILHSCSCIIEFITLVAEKILKDARQSPAAYRVSSTRVMNSIMHISSMNVNNEPFVDCCFRTTSALSLFVNLIIQMHALLQIASIIERMQASISWYCTLHEPRHEKTSFGICGNKGADSCALPRR